MGSLDLALRWQVLEGDSRDLLKTLPDQSVDAVVSDPPYELGFMGKAWDASGIAYSVELWAEVLRVLRPGGHLLAFGGSRTYHRLACAIEDAGFQIRDSLVWLYGSGFPKSVTVSNALKARDEAKAASQWSGWGTALKPAQEPIVLARPQQSVNVEGRWPANVLLSHSDECGDHCSEGCPVAELGDFSRYFYAAKPSKRERDAGLEDFPVAQGFEVCDREEGSAGASNPRAGVRTSRRNVHPTVKPLELMRYLVRLVTPPGGLVLDPFNGSGSTGCAAVLEGARYLGLELSPEYAELARARLRHWADEADRREASAKAGKQESLWQSLDGS